MSKTKFTPALSSLPLIHQGKTRDTFETNSPDTLLIVATQRLSTHNVIHLSEVPYKDQVLTALTIFWLTSLLGKVGIPHHLVAFGTDIYTYLPGKRSDYPADLHYRAIIVKKLSMVPVEFIYRGYLAGSLYKGFHSKGLPNPYGITLERGLPLMTQFPAPIFTPTDKSETDEPLDAQETSMRYPDPSRVSLQTFMLTRNHLRSRGVELVDSKFEVGIDQFGIATIADEIATPDSSRFCEFSAIEPGKEPPWFDKQIARDEAERVWDKAEKCPLKFSSEIIQKLSDTYLGICSQITGDGLQSFQRQYLEIS
ncbi:MAG TPA: phosphoribosylaminoimidazolesuccinocarboxamide synthase [Candidatus Paceibacterota bacterium]|nr:phosphoribosylaminoimidazolesuccinocarboxamide synthase [Candidatus Paceibacterota bacterium]